MSYQKKSLKLLQALTNIQDSVIDESYSITNKKKYRKRLVISIAAILALVITSISFIPRFTRENNGLQMKITYPAAYAFDSEEQFSVSNQYPVKDDFITSVNQFSYLTASKLLNEKENLNYSPLSLYYALAVASTGADGETAKQFQQLLGGYDSKDLSIACNHLYRQLYRDNNVSTVKIANSLWINQSNVKQSFVTNAAHNFYSSCHVMDFADSSASKAMSQWVSDQTDSHLKPTISLDPDQLLSILNTISFQGQWIDRFEKDQTKEGLFTTSQDQKISCDFMNRINQSSFTKTDQYTAASLSLKDSYSMTFILPSSSSSVKEIASSPELLQSIFSQEPTGYGKVTWKVPKMDFSSSFKLNDSLKELGLSSAFLPSANFSNMIEGPSWIGTVNQNTRITLDEEGVTASAFTQIDYNGSAMPTDEAKMILDRPFLYAITSGNGCVLFIGCYNRP